MSVLAARLWHYWIGVPLAIASIGMVAAMIAGYVVRVIRPKYPRR